MVPLHDRDEVSARPQCVEKMGDEEAKAENINFVKQDSEEEKSR